MSYCRLIISFSIFIICIVQSSFAEDDDESSDDDDNARIYRSPEDRREAELGTKLNEWLAFSGSLELEKEYFEDNLDNGKKIRGYEDTVPTLQFELEFSFADWWGAELVYEFEYEEERKVGMWDEAFVYFEFEDIGLEVEAGRVTVPFGEFDSYFVTDPFLEFAETTKNGLVIEYTIIDVLEFSAFAIDSDVDKQKKSREYDWGGRLEFVSNNESIRIGLSYISDIAESDERLLRDEGDLYKKRVSAWNAYALFGFENFEITAEVIQATTRFREFDAEEDKPKAYNIELAYLPNPNLLIAIRYEGSDEIEEAPEVQYGVNVTWQPISKVSFSLDYLHGKYKNNFVFDDDDNEFKDRDLIAVELGLEF